jgi:hypothetical protein
MWLFEKDELNGREINSLKSVNVDCNLISGEYRTDDEAWKQS